MHKVSANFEDKNRIREWAAEGLSPEEIQEKVKVKADYIRAYLDSLEGSDAEEVSVNEEEVPEAGDDEEVSDDEGSEDL